MGTLDHDFGAALPPERDVSAAEKKYAPSSLEKLNPTNGMRLKNLMEEVGHGNKFPKLTFWSLSILWIMDEHGDVYFAVEEIVSSRGGLVAVLPADVEVPKGKSKLGHPSLVRGANARIAGEIYFDINMPTPAWMISNRSGRYGLRKTTEERHLENVSEIFKKHKISLEIDFIA